MTVYRINSTTQGLILAPNGVFSITLDALPPTGPVLLGFQALTLSTSSTPGAQSVTVPAGTEAVVVMARTNAGSLTMSSSFAGTWTVVSSSGNTCHLQHAPVTATGAQTITPQWAFGPGEGPVFFVWFVGGVDSSAPANWVRDGAAEESNSVTIDSAADDLVLVMDNAYAPTGDFPGVPSGYTSQGTQNNNNLGARGRTLDTASGPTTTINREVGPVSTAFHGLCAISIFGS